MHKFIKNQFAIILFFFILFIIGFFAYDDYGIGIDEDNSRINGFISLKYIYEIFNINLLDQIDGVKLENISDYGEQGNGVIFDLPLAFLESFFKINDFRNQFLLRHFLSYIIFFISLIYFYKLIINKNNSQILAVTGVLFLFFSPRIFAQSFFNPKDVGFMSLCIINMFYGIKYLERKDLKSAIIFSMISGVCVGFRILGLFIPLIIIFIAWIDKLRDYKNLKKNNSLILLIFFLPLFITFFWPYLWSDPLNNFVNAFKILSNHYRPINNLFMGDYVSALYVPWYYVLIWIAITTPIIYLFLFFVGLFFVLKRLYRRLIKIEVNTLNDLWRGKNEKIDLINLIIIILPIMTVIIFHSSLYTGWRHLYFIYPFVILISIQGIYLLNLLLFKNLKKIFSIVLIFTVPTVFWMFKNHPYQYVYFNYFAGKQFSKNFDMDYWGLSNYNALKYLIKNNQNLISIGIIGNGDIGQSRMFLNKTDKNRIVITDNFKKADFLIDNFNRWDGLKKVKKNSIIENNFHIYYEITIDNNPITRIYRKNIK